MAFSADNLVIHNSYDWGCYCGVKQPLGAYDAAGDLSVHLLSKPEGGGAAASQSNPDHIAYVDDSGAPAGGLDQLTTDVNGAGHGPPTHLDLYTSYAGGQITFDDDGRYWINLGARAAADELPLHVYSSDNVYDLSAFTCQLNDYRVGDTCTTPCIIVTGGKVYVFWRQGHTNGVTTSVRMRRYPHTGAAIGGLEAEVLIYQGSAADEHYGAMSLEQFNIRYDARTGLMFLTLTPWAFDVTHFGSPVFLYSDDMGTTWKRADGTEMTLPVRYDAGDQVLIPYDTIPGEEYPSWEILDIGISPGGNFFLTVRKGLHNSDSALSTVSFYRWNGQWEETWISGNLYGQTKPHAVVATSKYLYLLYSERANGNLIKAMASNDGGRTWSAPETVVTLGASEFVNMISACEPHDAPADDKARFYYQYCETTGNTWENRRVKNKIAWLRLEYS